MAMTIGCSDGTIEIDDLGYVIDDPRDCYPEIVRFDLDEYQDWCRSVGLVPSAQHEDILLLGYWMHDGTYEPGEPDARAEALETYVQDISEEVPA